MVDDTDISIGPVYVAFDGRTGRILQRHARFNAEKNSYADAGADELRAMLVDDPWVLSVLTGGDIANLDIVAVAADQTGPARVNLKTRTLEPLPRIHLTADRQAIEGDGKDSVRVEIAVRGRDGALLAGANGSIKVSTTRGRLSARGGVVELKGGQASIVLTSVPETVSAVVVSAMSPDQPYLDGAVEVEFL